MARLGEKDFQQSAWKGPACFRHLLETIVATETCSLPSEEGRDGSHGQEGKCFERAHCPRPNGGAEVFTFNNNRAACP
jgi:hypothetical protein